MNVVLRRHRYLVVVGAVLIQFALGAIYAWSVFTPMLTDHSGPYRFSATEAQAVFMVGLATFAVVMLYAGRLLATWGPRRLVLASAVTLGLGYVAGGLFGNTFIEQIVWIGLVGGAGIGLGYVVPIAVCVAWFPDRKGLVSGLAVAGFGFGAAAWVKLAGTWFGGLLHSVSLLGLPGVQSVFIIYGATFFMLVFIGAAVMVMPPHGWRPSQWTPPEPAAAAASGGVSLTAAEMRTHTQYWLMFGIFLFSAMAGLMVIGSIKLFGIDVLQLYGYDTSSASVVAGTAMAWFAIANGLGRILWGMAGDVIGRKAAVILMTMLQGVTMVLTYHVFVTYGHGLGFIVAASIIGFNFGGNFALMPAWTADLFGNARVGGNYPWVFLAYGVAGIAGPLAAGFFKDMAGSGFDPMVWMWPFLLAVVGCFIAAVLAALVNPLRQT